jgi:hypothetical protein
VEGLPKAEEEVIAKPAARRSRAASTAAGLVVLACALAAPRVAAADDDDPTEVNLNRARKLMESRATLDQACKWLENAYGITQRGDMLLNLAECHRRQGKTASAWAEFDKAIRIGAEVRFPEAVAAATKLRDDLATHVSRITVSVAPAVARLPGFAVELDGKPLAPAGWNTAAPHNPGAVEVTAHAKGYKPFTAHLDVGNDREDKTVDVALEAEPPPPPPKPVPPPPPGAPSRSIWPWIVGGIGVALGAAAIGFEADSRSAASDLDAHCGGPPRNACPRTYNFAPVRARELRSYDLFVGLGAASLVAIGTGATVLVLRRPGSAGTSTSLRLSPTSASILSSF